MDLLNTNKVTGFLAKALVMLSLIAFVSSCSTISTKNITYLQGQGSLDTLKYTTLDSLKPVVAKIQPDDILAITVSSLSEESNLLFNFPILNPITTTNFPGGSGAGAQKNQPLGYLVDPEGNIEMPLLGKTILAGLTLEQAGSLIKSKLVKYLKEPTVNVRMLNHKFTVLGEVNRPGVYNLLDNHTSLLDVLGMSGDLTIYGRRDNVMLVRTSNSGKRDVVKIDLTKREFMNSPYYYIQNNDMIYIETLEGKITSTDRTIQLIPIITGVTSTFVLLLNLVFK